MAYQLSRFAISNGIYPAPIVMFLVLVLVIRYSIIFIPLLSLLSVEILTIDSDYGKRLPERHINYKPKVILVYAVIDR